MQNALSFFINYVKINKNFIFKFIADLENLRFMPGCFVMWCSFGTSPAPSGQKVENHEQITPAA